MVDSNIYLNWLSLGLKVKSTGHSYGVSFAEDIMLQLFGSTMRYEG